MECILHKHSILFSYLHSSLKQNHQTMASLHAHTGLRIRSPATIPKGTCGCTTASRKLRATEKIERPPCFINTHIMIKSFHFSQGRIQGCEFFPPSPGFCLKNAPCLPLSATRTAYPWRHGHKPCSGTC